MYTRLLLFLIVVGSCWLCNATDQTENHFTRKKIVPEARHAVEAGRMENLCTLCEEFSSEAINYLSENITQTEIISILHESCSKIPTFVKQCTVLVDYYAPLFFMEVSSVQPEEFCKKFGLCNDDAASISKRISKNKCDLCHEIVTDALLKLKDPDTELDVVKLLLKACESFGKGVKKCKRVVFEYAPIIMINAEKLLETNDICTMLRACSSTPVGAEQAIVRIQTSMSAAS